MLTNLVRGHRANVQLTRNFVIDQSPFYIKLHLNYRAIGFDYYYINHGEKEGGGEKNMTRRAMIDPPSAARLAAPLLRSRTKGIYRCIIKTYIRNKSIVHYTYAYIHETYTYYPYI